MANENEIRTQIRQFVINNFLLGDAEAMLKDKESFLESGTIDSTGVLEVVTFLEETFGFMVEDLELLPENLDSVDNLVRYVGNKKMGAAKHAA